MANDRSWHYATAEEERERTKKRKSMSKEAYRKYENEEQRKFNEGQRQARRDKIRKNILGGSGGRR